MNLAQQAKDWLLQVFAHDHAAKSEILRAVMAKGYGLEPSQFSRPFPGSQPPITNNTTTVNEGGKVAPLIQGAILSAAMVAAGASGAWWLLPAAKVLPEVAKPVQTSPAAPAKTTEWEVRWKMGPDGKWQTEVSPVPAKE